MTVRKSEVETYSWATNVLTLISNRFISDYTFVILLHSFVHVSFDFSPPEKPVLPTAQHVQFIIFRLYHALRSRTFAGAAFPGRARDHVEN